MIIVQRIVECNLVVSSEINNKKDCTIESGKGYYKEENEEYIVYFTKGETKYKYIYNNGLLKVMCNDSCYEFKENEYKEGQIKNGEYVFVITTFATKIEMLSNKIILNYVLSQGDYVIGKYESELSFN